MKERKSNYVIAITGGIGSGKSEILRMLKKEYPVFSCDEIAKSLYFDKNVAKKLKNIFPAAVSEVDLSVDFEELKKQAFSSKENTEKLNKLIHPLTVKKVFSEAKTKTPQGVSFVEVPLLFESNTQNKFDGVLVVSRGVENRIAAVMKRSALTCEEVKDRMKSQVDYDSFDYSVCRKPIAFINNDGSREDLVLSAKAKIHELMKKI